MFAMLATSCAKKAEPQDNSSSSSSSESVSAVSEKSESLTSEQPTEESKETSKVSESVPKTTQKKNEQSKQTTSKTTKPSTTKPKPKPTAPTTTKPAEEKINPAEIQAEINAYIASKGWEVNSSLTPQNAGWNGAISANQPKSKLIADLKYDVDEFPPSFGKYCYYDAKAEEFYILYD